MILLQASLMDSLMGSWPLIMMFVVIYFFFIRPQSRKARDQANFVKGMAKGDQVVTNGGIVGKISKLTDSEVTLQVDQKSYITFLRSTINHEMTKSLEKAGAK